MQKDGGYDSKQDQNQKKGTKPKKQPPSVPDSMETRCLVTFSDPTIFRACEGANAVRKSAFLACFAPLRHGYATFSQVYVTKLDRE